MRFAKRTDWITEPNELSRLIEAKRARGEAILDLIESNPTRCGFDYLKPELLQALNTPQNLLYSPDPHGLLETRKAICAYYAEKGIALEPDQIFLTASTSEAYSFIFRLLCDPGDRAAFPRPSYPLFGYLSQINDVELLAYSLQYEDGWRLDEKSVEKAVLEKPKALIIVNPNNPTGNFVKPQELDFLNSVCSASETALVSDEVFLDFFLDEQFGQPLSLAGNEKILTFTVSGISKILGLPQMKLSWIVVNGPEKLRQKAIERLEIISDTYLSVNTPSQRALGAWLEHRQTILDEIRNRLLANYHFLLKTFDGKNDAKVLKVEGGWYALLETHSAMRDEELAMRLIEQENVIVHPGYFFDCEEENVLTFSLLQSPDIFQKGIARFVSLTRRPSVLK